MRKFTKFLIPALLIVAVIVSCAIMFASATDTVIYVSSTGTGDGSSPESPLGPGLVNATVTYGSETHTFTDATYDDAIAKLLEIRDGGAKKITGTTAVWNASAFYRALAAIGANDGTIVIMDAVPFNMTERLESLGAGGSAADSQVPTSISGNITITSNYGGVDYRTSGAALVYDQTGWNSINLWFRSAKTTWKDINIEHRFDSGKVSATDTWVLAGIYCGGNKTVFDTGVSVKSYDYKTGSPVEMNSQVSVFAGARYQVRPSGDLTIKSGEWLGVYGAGHCLNAANPGYIEGNSVINIEGGEILCLYGAGSLFSNRNLAYVGGDLDINITGGEVSNIYALTSAGVKGAMTIDVVHPAKVFAANLTADEKTPANVPTSVKFTYDDGTVDAVNGFAAADVVVKGNVVYVSADGTGDGSTPEAPIGNASVTGSIYDKAGAVVATFENTPYADAVAKLAQLQAEGQATLLDKQNILRGANALYRAFQALNGRTGTVVIVGKTAIDVADRMETNVQGPAEFKLPSNQGVVTITSNYNGVDYAKTNGAKLVFDRSVWNSMNVELSCKTVWENLTIEHSTTSSQTGNWPTNCAIYCSGFDTVFGEGITTTSWNAKDNKSGGSFIYIFAGKRYGQVSTDADGLQLTVKSGLWHGVFASGCGMTTANEHGKVTGNVTIDITNCGKGTSTNVVALGTGGYFKRNSAGVIGDVTVNVGSKVRIQETLYAQSGAGVSGNVVINLAKDAVLSEKSTFLGVKYTDGLEKLYTPASVKLNFYKANLDEAMVENKADFENGANEYNVLDDIPTPPPAGDGTGTPTVTEGVVVYVANVSKGTGDGSSPENAMGHANITGTITKNGDSSTVMHTFNDTPYAEALAEIYTSGSGKLSDSGKLFAKAHAFNRALLANDSALIKNGGAIVIVDEFTIGYADGMRNSFAEFQWLGADGAKNITITSYYNGVDYRATGAKLVLDTTLYGINWRIKAPTTWEFLNIEAKYDSSRSSGKAVDGVGMISFYGYKTVIDEEINVTSNDKAGKTQYYPSLTAGDRMGTGKNAVVEGDTDLTINSGNWGRVYGSNYGMRTSGGDQYGARKGNVNVTVNGGKVGELYGTVYTNTNFTFGLDGNVTINLNGGEVNTVYASSPVGVTGKINVTVDKSVTGLAKVWGYAYAENFAAPTDATITYDRSNLSDDKVMYFTTVNATGEAPIAPPPPPPPVTGADVVYISANGTGDGSSADKPLGNAAGYVAAKNSHLNNAFYLAFKALGENGGTIVVVDDVVLDSVESRFPTKEGEKQAPSEFQMPKHIKGTVVVTSVYGGVDYRAQNDAKLVLDLDTCNTQFINFYNAVTLKDLDVEHKYDPNDLNGWGTAFAFAANGYAFTVDEGVNVTSLNADTNAAGDFYPMILGGHRYLNIVGRTPSVTVKSGTWDTVIAGSYGMGGIDKTYGTYGNVDADVNLTIEGGKIKKVFVTGPDRAASASGTVFGKATVNVTGGEIESFYFSHTVEYKGTGSVVNFGANSKVAFADYALKNYKGSLDELKTKVTFNIENGVELGKEPEKAPVVIYISANGTGDGSSPEAPLGNDPGYVADNKSFYGLAFYKAFEKLKNDKGIIVVVGDTQIDSVESRFEHDDKGNSKAPSELTLPAAGGKVVITSVYGGVDYRANAKLILDQATCATTFLTFKSDVTFENINIEHRYESTDLNTWGTPFAIAANGNELVMGENVNVTAFDVAKNTAGTFYPMILGGHRFVAVKSDANVTIKSGNWSTVIAGSHSMGASYKGTVEGDATLNIEGGKIDTVLGTSSIDYPYGEIKGKLTINVTGGEVGVLYASANNGAENEIEVTIADTAERVGGAWATSGSATIANATITYDRSVIRDDEVKNFGGDVTVNGDVSEQPEKIYYTVYVADQAMGAGDGSSPENAIGAASDYWVRYARVCELLAIAKADRTEAQEAEVTALKSLYKSSALYRALNETDLIKKGGKLVVVGPLTVNATDSLALPNSQGDFNWPKAGASQIIITSVDKGVDYRAQGAKFIIDRNNVGVSINVKTPTVWENLDIEYRYNSANSMSVGGNAIIWNNCNKVVFGEGLKMIPVDSNPGFKSDLYPNVVGGHRFSNQNGNPDITIKSGTFGTVIGGNFARVTSKKLEDGTTEYTGYGHLKGDVNITVEGGKITTLIGTCRDDVSNARVTVTGNVNIDIKGNAEVVKLLAANRYGLIDGKLVVNVTEDSYVGTAYGYNYTAATKDYQPEDATLNYVRSAIFEADVKYWTTVNASGEGQPGVHGPVIYVANTSRGKGDGSSPENAIGNAADYNSVRNQALAIIKANGGTNSNLPKDKSTIVGSVYKKSALYLALSKNGNQVINEGGYIVVCEPLTINSTDGMRRALADFRWPTTGTKTIYFTSKYDGVDYRWKGAKVILDCVDLGLAIDMRSPTNWDNIVFEHKYNSKNGKGVDNGAVLNAGGCKTVIGYNVGSIATDINPDEEKRVEIYPSISGGGRYSDYKMPTHLTINGGQWAMVVGGSWTGENTGSATIGIGGGKIGTVCGSGKPTSSKQLIGSVWIGLWGGEVDNVYGCGKKGIKWGSVAVGCGSGITINGKVYATHPDYEGDAITAIAYYYSSEINEKKFVGFSTINPQTGSTLVYLGVVAAFALVSTGVVISKKRKRIED